MKTMLISMSCQVYGHGVDMSLAAREQVFNYQLSDQYFKSAQTLSGRKPRITRKKKGPCGPLILKLYSDSWSTYLSTFAFISSDIFK